MDRVGKKVGIAVGIDSAGRFPAAKLVTSTPSQSSPKSVSPVLPVKNVYRRRLVRSIETGTANC